MGQSVEFHIKPNLYPLSYYPWVFFLAIDSLEFKNITKAFHSILSANSLLSDDSNYTIKKQILWSVFKCVLQIIAFVPITESNAASDQWVFVLLTFTWSKTLPR